MFNFITLSVQLYGPSLICLIPYFLHFKHLQTLFFQIQLNNILPHVPSSENGLLLINKCNFQLSSLWYSNIYLTRYNITQFILSGNCSTYFGWYHHPSSGAQTTVSTASGICHTVTAICRYRGRNGTGLSVLWVAVTVWQIPDAVDTVACAPDDGWWYHPKHVEQFPYKINCVTLHLFGYILE